MQYISTHVPNRSNGYDALLIRSCVWLHWSVTLHTIDMNHLHTTVAKGRSSWDSLVAYGDSLFNLRYGFRKSSHPWTLIFNTSANLGRHTLQRKHPSQPTASFSYRGTWGQRTCAAARLKSRFTPGDIILNFVLNLQWKKYSPLTICFIYSMQQQHSTTSVCNSSLI